jgi:hypothetical protein
MNAATFMLINLAMFSSNWLVSQRSLKPVHFLFKFLRLNHNISRRQLIARSYYVFIVIQGGIGENYITNPLAL